MLKYIQDKNLIIFFHLLCIWMYQRWFSFLFICWRLCYKHEALYYHFDGVWIDGIKTNVCVCVCILSFTWWFRHKIFFWYSGCKWHSDFLIVPLLWLVKGITYLSIAFKHVWSYYRPFLCAIVLDFLRFLKNVFAWRPLE